MVLIQDHPRSQTVRGLRHLVGGHREWRSGVGTQWTEDGGNVAAGRTYTTKYGRMDTNDAEMGGG